MTRFLLITVIGADRNRDSAGTHPARKSGTLGLPASTAGIDEVAENYVLNTLMKVTGNLVKHQIFHPSVGFFLAGLVEQHHQDDPF